jgi:arginyl-tRNA synthetase
MAGEEDQKKGLSKNQLKKIAKMAEKKQKKETAKAGGGNPAPSNAPAAAVAPPKKHPELLLVNLGSQNDKLSAIKAVWASLRYSVPLKKSTTQKVPLAHGPALVYDSVPGVSVMGGNSMAKAIASFSRDTTVISPTEVMKTDEWCEWERHLRHSHNLHNAIGHMEHVLTETGSSPFHLIGHDTTVADICVVTTLSSMTGGHHLPPHVAQYLEAHSAALEAAKVALETLPAATGGRSSKSVDLDNPSLQKVMDQAFSNALVELFGEEIVEKLPPLIVQQCKSSKFGDYQTSIAMKLFSQLKKDGALPDTMKSPPDVANALVEALMNSSDVVVELKVDKGFVVCRVAPSLLERRVSHYLYDTGRLPIPEVTPQTCLVDFSSPNIAKEMHVGHLRSTIIGESICRILERVGHFVHRVNHVGDWGTQFGMLIQYLKEEFPNFHENMPNITDLTEFYKSAKGRFDESPEFKKQSQLNVVKLQSGDEECMEIWKILCDVSRSEFKKVYDRLDIKVEEFGESFYNDKIPAVVEEFGKAGLLSIEEGGAKCVWGDGFQIPLMLVKSDGGYGYDSTDMAALKYRLQVLKCQRIIVVTDFSQGDHFKMCYAAARKKGWVTDQKLEHIGFGTVMGEDGKRFKTRSGDTVRLVDLLDEAVNRMESSLKERIDDGTANITVDEVHKVAEAIGYGAVKFFDLSRNPTSNYKFSYDQMLDLKGKTAVYLLYAYARLHSICTKALNDHNVDVSKLIADKTPISLGHPSERNLAFNLLQFSDTMSVTLEDLFPYHICDYLYNLSIAASDFVTQCKVLGSPEMKSRLILCRATTMAMRECFDLLAIRHVDRI